MNKNRLMSALLALLLTAVLTAAPVLAEAGALPALVDAAGALLLDTDNVTITGTATFRLDGDRFKTAEIRYVQDGTSSFWQEKLLTPRAMRTDRETGFTVIANGNEIAVMEPYTPGSYRNGYDVEQDSVLRDSLEARLLLSLARSAAAVLEPALPVSQEGDAVVIRVAEGQSPALLNDLLLMAGRFAGKRLFGIEFDGEIIDHEDWDLTETREILLQTEACRLLSASVSIRRDAQGRLAGAEGAAAVALTYVNGDQRRLDVDFSLAVGEYGTSSVKAFDPEDYQVLPMPEALARNEKAAQEKANAMAERAREAWKAAGLARAAELEMTNWYLYDGLYTLTMEDPEDESGLGYYVEFTEEGAVQYLSKSIRARYEDWDDLEVPVTVELTDDMRSRIDAFIQAVNPGLRYGELEPYAQHESEGEVFIDLAYESPEDDVWMDLVIQLEPTWEITHYTSVGNG